MFDPSLPPGTSRYREGHLRVGPNPLPPPPPSFNRAQAGADLSRLYGSVSQLAAFTVLPLYGIYRLLLPGPRLSEQERKWAFTGIVMGGVWAIFSIAEAVDRRRRD